MHCVRCQCLLDSTIAALAFVAPSKLRHDSANTVCGQTDLLVSNITKQWHGSKFYICGHSSSNGGSNLLRVEVLGCSSKSKQFLTSLNRRFIINLHGFQLRQLESNLLATGFYFSKKNILVLASSVEYERTGELSSPKLWFRSTTWGHFSNSNNSKLFSFQKI